MTTIARFSVRIDDSADWAATFDRRLRPVLARHGLQDPTLPDRASAAGWCSWLFAVEDPGAIQRIRTALNADTSWAAEVNALGPAANNGPRWRLELYRTDQAPDHTTAADIGYRNGLWHSFTPNDGLPPHSTIIALQQDAKGDLWFITGVYLVHFDGVRLRYWSDPARLYGPWGHTEDKWQYQSALHAAANGLLWIGSELGLSRWDGREFDYYTTTDHPGLTRVRTICESLDGRLWLGTVGGLVCFDPATGTLAEKQMDLRITALRPRRDGGFWIAADTGLYRYDDGATVPLAAEMPASVYIYRLLEDRQGRLWLGTSQGVFTLEDGRLSAFSRDQGLPQARVMDVLEDHQGNIWFTQSPLGLVRYDGRQCQSFKAQDGLENDQTQSLLEDRQHNLWVGCWNGVSRWDGLNFTHFTQAEGLTSTGITDLCKDPQGRLWCATWDGLCYYDGTRWHGVPQTAGLNLWFVLADPQGHIWCSGPDCPGIYRYDGEQLTCYEPPLKHKGAAKGLIDPQGRVWFMHLFFSIQTELSHQHRLGVSCFDGQTLHYYPIWDEPSDRPFCMVNDGQGALWCGGTSGLIRFFDGERRMFGAADGLQPGWVFMATAGSPQAGGGVWLVVQGSGLFLQHFDGTRFRTFPVPLEKPVLTENQALYMDRRGHLWFSTYDCLVQFDGESFRFHGPDAGVCPGSVFKIIEDERGHLWFGSYAGITRYDGQVFQQLTRHDGLIHDGVVGLYADADGSVWGATQGGLFRYRAHDASPTIVLKDVISDRHYGPVERIEITDTQKLVAFEFQGGSLRMLAHRFVYLYRLEGHDPTWRNTLQNRVEYRDLAQGTYTFEVKAVDLDFNYSSPLRVTVQVEPDPLQAAWTAALSEGASEGFIGQSQAVAQVKQQLAQAATTDLNLLILGETGTGKGLAARYLHRLSPRHDAPFVLVTCGAIPEGLIESELFGHEKGAFTGAVGQRVGKIELAAGGTLFLDEIGDMPLLAQVRLLHLLQEGVFYRVGSEKEQRADVRIVAATNRPLAEMVQQGEFRQDLYYRLQGYELVLPPLRQRLEDVPLLAQYFAARYAQHLSRPEPHFTDEATAHLQAYTWPGNVRELEHLVQRAVLNTADTAIGGDDVLRAGLPMGAPAATSTDFLSMVEMEKKHILDAIEHCGGKIGGRQGAAHLLGLNVSTLRGRMRKYGIQPKTS